MVYWTNYLHTGWGNVGHIGPKMQQVLMMMYWEKLILHRLEDSVYPETCITWMQIPIYDMYLSHIQKK